jgi:hypothetical protein
VKIVFEKCESRLLFITLLVFLLFVCTCRCSRFIIIKFGSMCWIFKFVDKFLYLLLELEERNFVLKRRLSPLRPQVSFIMVRQFLREHRTLAWVWNLNITRRLQKDVSMGHISCATSKFNIYKPLIRPQLLFGSEGWVLTRLVFEGKVLRKICNPKIENMCVYRRRYSFEVEIERELDEHDFFYLL